MTLNTVSLFCKDNQLSLIVRMTLVQGFFLSGILHCVTWFGPFKSVTQWFVVLSKRNRVVSHNTMETSTPTTVHYLAHGFKVREFLI